MLFFKNGVFLLNWQKAGSLWITRLSRGQNNRDPTSTALLPGSFELGSEMLSKAPRSGISHVRECKVQRGNILVEADRRAGGGSRGPLCHPRTRGSASPRGLCPAGERAGKKQGNALPWGWSPQDPAVGRKGSVLPLPMRSALSPKSPNLPRGQGVSCSDHKPLQLCNPLASYPTCAVASPSSRLASWGAAGAPRSRHRPADRSWQGRPGAGGRGSRRRAPALLKYIFIAFLQVLQKYDKIN